MKVFDIVSIPDDDIQACVRDVLSPEESNLLVQEGHDLQFHHLVRIDERNRFSIRRLGQRIMDEVMPWPVVAAGQLSKPGEKSSSLPIVVRPPSSFTLMLKEIEVASKDPHGEFGLEMTLTVQAREIQQDEYMRDVAVRALIDQAYTTSHKARMSAQVIEI